MYTTKKSSLKTDVEGFNQLSSRKEIKKALKDLLGQEGWLYEFTDVDATNIEGSNHPYYINCEDTIVIQINDDAETALRLAKFATRECADEFHYFMTDENKYIVRIWWD